MLSLTEENYLKTIFHLSMSENETQVGTNAIAEKINTKASSVTDMLKKLSDKSYLKYEPYQGVSLTLKGKKAAIEIIRKHRLWEVFLVDKLHFNWDEIHDIAEQLEHINSIALIDKLDAFLGFPTKDPHGDPIPDANGKMPAPYSITLSDLKANEIGVVVGVNDSSSDFLRYLDQIGVALGSQIAVKETFDFDQSLDIVLNNEKSLHLSNEAAKNIMMSKK